MPAPQTVSSAASVADLEAALRALHIATIHLDQATAGPTETVLVTRSRALVRQATSLLAAAVRMRRPDEPDAD